MVTTLESGSGYPRRQPRMTAKRPNLHIVRNALSSLDSFVVDMHGPVHS